MHASSGGKVCNPSIISATLGLMYTMPASWRRRRGKRDRRGGKRKGEGRKREGKGKRERVKREKRVKERSNEEKSLDPPVYSMYTSH